RYRRALYTFLKRSAIYPSFLTFDASARGVSLARRTPTNTPLQALVTLNDPVYHEAAEALAHRMLPFDVTASIRGGGVLNARRNFGARCVLSRDLTAEESAILAATYHDVMKMQRTAVKQELGALTAIASVLLNLDAAFAR